MQFTNSSYNVLIVIRKVNKILSLLSHRLLGGSYDDGIGVDIELAKIIANQFGKNGKLDSFIEWYKDETSNDYTDLVNFTSCCILTIVSVNVYKL